MAPLSAFYTEEAMRIMESEAVNLNEKRRKQKMTDIFKSIQAERARQDEKHPVTPKYFLHPHTHCPIIEYMAISAKDSNDDNELCNTADWYNVMREELLETFAEQGDTVESLTRMRSEAIQGAALYVRLIETIDGMIDKLAK